MIIIPTRSPSVAQSTDSIAVSTSSAPTRTTTAAPTRATFVRWPNSSAIAKRATAKADAATRATTNPPSCGHINDEASIHSACAGAARQWGRDPIRRAPPSSGIRAPGGAAPGLVAPRRPRGAQSAGGMWWFPLNRSCGSWSAFTSRRRAQVSASKKRLASVGSITKFA